MAGIPKELLLKCRLALKLTQEELGDLLGKSKRTIQRWEDHGTILLPSDAEALARALQPVEPDLATQIVAFGAETAELIGAPPPHLVDGADAVVAAAARAMKVAPESIHSGVVAAFEQAAETGLTVREILAGLKRTR